MINIQNFDDNECFKCLVRYLYHADQNPKRWKSLVDELDFEDIKFRVKIEYIHKILKNVSIGISVFGYGNKVKYPTYMPENVLQALASGVQGWNQK